MNYKADEINIFVATISSTFAISTLLSLAVLIFANSESTEVTSFCQLLWFATVLFAVTSFRCIDQILDRFSDDKGDAYVLWPKNIKWQKIITVDKRVIDFGGAIVLFFCAWISFSLVMFCMGTKMGLFLPLNYISVGMMIVFALLFVTRRILYIT